MLVIQRTQGRNGYGNTPYCLLNSFVDLKLFLKKEKKKVYYSKKKKKGNRNWKNNLIKGTIIFLTPTQLHTDCLLKSGIWPKNSSNQLMQTHFKGPQSF